VDGTDGAFVIPSDKSRTYISVNHKDVDTMAEWGHEVTHLALRALLDSKNPNHRQVAKVAMVSTQAAVADSVITFGVSITLQENDFISLTLGDELFQVQVNADVWGVLAGYVDGDFTNGETTDWLPLLTALAGEVDAAFAADVARDWTLDATSTSGSSGYTLTLRSSVATQDFKDYFGLTDTGPNSDAPEILSVIPLTGFDDVLGMYSVSGGVDFDDVLVNLAAAINAKTGDTGIVATVTDGELSLSKATGSFVVNGAYLSDAGVVWDTGALRAAGSTQVQISEAAFEAIAFDVAQEFTMSLDGQPYTATKGDSSTPASVMNDLRDQINTARSAATIAFSGAVAVGSKYVVVLDGVAYSYTAQTGNTWTEVLNGLVSAITNGANEPVTAAVKGTPTATEGVLALTVKSDITSYRAQAKVVASDNTETTLSVTPDIVAISHSDDNTVSVQGLRFTTHVVNTSFLVDSPTAAGVTTTALENSKVIAESLDANNQVAAKVEAGALAKQVSTLNFSGSNPDSNTIYKVTVNSTSYTAQPSAGESWASLMATLAAKVTAGGVVVATPVTGGTMQLTAVADNTAFTLRAQAEDTGISSGSSVLKPQGDYVLILPDRSPGSIGVVATGSLSVVALPTKDGETIRLGSDTGGLVVVSDLDVGSGTIYLDAAQGGIALGGAVTAGVLDVSSRDELTLTTEVEQILVDMTGSGDLTVTQTGDLLISHLQVAGGDVTFTVAGDVTFTGGSATDGTQGFFDKDGTGSVANTLTILDVIDEVVRQREHYRGNGTPNFYTSPGILANMLLVRNGVDERMFRDKSDLAAAMMVNDVISVPPMVGKQTDVEGTMYNLVGILVNPNDYTYGADKGGKTAFFDQFDIDVNQEKYLYEARTSGALTVPKAAMVFEQDSTPVA
jgi:hypothetical protein